MQVAETFVFELPEGDETEAVATTADPALSLSSPKHSRAESGASSGDDSSAATSFRLVFRPSNLTSCSCVTVVYAASFFHIFDDPDRLADVEENANISPRATRTITNLLIDRIELADIILLNKTDLVPIKDVEAIEKVLRRLNLYGKFERTANF